MDGREEENFWRPVVMSFLCFSLDLWYIFGPFVFIFSYYGPYDLFFLTGLSILKSV
jgi:hypothetical protein